jgi:hypothetical protein
MRRYGVLIVCVLINLFIFGVDKEEIKKLIDKIDSVEIKEREEAMKQLKNIAKNDKEVLEILKTESKNENNSYNVRFFLRKLVKEIEQEGQSQNQFEPKDDHQDTKDEKETKHKIINRFFGNMKITICNNNKCQTYEGYSCEDLLQKYPELKNQLNCDEDSLSIKAFNRTDDIFEQIKKFEEELNKDLFNKEKEWQKRIRRFFNPKRFKSFTNPPGPGIKEKEIQKPQVQKRAERIWKYVDIGMEVEELSDEELNKLGSGVRVKNIQKGGLADEELKLKENDIIISINEEKIYNKWTLRRQLKSFLNGEPTKIEIYRDGKVQILQY